MISGLPLRWVLLFLFPNLSHQTSSGTFSVTVQSPVSALLGSSVSLHCALANNMDARHLEVHWYRPKMSDTPALLYKNTQIQKSPVDVQYQGRVSLSGELDKGDVSLKMEKLMLADRGDYVCHVGSENWFDEATLSLSLRAVGSTPVLSINEAGGGKMNVSCQSHGWLPEPSIIWTDKDGRDLKHLSKNKFTKNSEGVVDVTSWLIVSPSESMWISCSVGLSDQERKDSRITLYIPLCVTESVNGYAIGIPVLLLLCAAGIAVFCMLHKKGLILSKRKRTENRGDKTSGAPSEREPLNKIPVENQDQNDAPFMNTVPDDVVVDKTSGAPSEREPLNKIPVENQDQNDAPSMNTVPDDVVGDIDQNSEQKAEIPSTSTPNLSQQKSEQQNPEAVKEKPQLTESRGDQRDSSSFAPVCSTACSATEEPNSTASISNPKPAATMSDSEPSTITSNPTPVQDAVDNLTIMFTGLESNPDLDEVKKFKVNITINPDETPEFLTQDRNKVFCNLPRPAWDINSSDEDEKVFTLCNARFNVGKRYWEVKVRESHKIEKLSWFVGVASEAAEREYNIPLTPQNKFWVLSYEEEKGLYIRDKAELISLPDVHKELTAVGVFLDCDEHTLSFYNINTTSHIYTFTNVEPRRISLRPLISPGVRDSYPVCIL
ncbi:butyrophilin subfamily 2 member A1-like isoform X2 [Neoarius graeffei]|uniref:butyrophilin subfamily 2 member A1-like isoform X2 n=1 Tax=Neoarius graeffei TaxID=443677 RepID=UPI00298BD477|nr:butyrophilin subfamily 2 member A1-like isoform X2 [Neoarius graeffei]